METSSHSQAAPDWFVRGALLAIVLLLAFISLKLQQVDKITDVRIVGYKMNKQNINLGTNSVTAAGIPITVVNPAPTPAPTPTPAPAPGQ